MCAEEVPAVATEATEEAVVVEVVDVIGVGRPVVSSVPSGMFILAGLAVLIPVFAVEASRGAACVGGVLAFAIEGVVGVEEAPVSV